MTTLDYVFRVQEVDKVVDGDTYRLRVSVGFHLTALITVRLDGWDCPELHGPTARERAAAIAARDVAAAWLQAHTGTLFVHTEPDPDSFGRWLGDLWTDLDDRSVVHLGDALARLELATPWPTRWRDVYDTGNEAAP